LSLFHGITPAFLLDLLALGGGIAVYLMRQRILSMLSVINPLLRLGPAQWYSGILEGLKTIAAWQTRILQNGYLRGYLQMILLAAFASGTGAALSRQVQRPGSAEPAFAGLLSGLSDFRPAIAALILLAALAAIHASSRLKAFAALGVVGYSMGVIFISSGAPDLAMTQFIVESLLVIVLVLAFYHLPPFIRISSFAARVRDLALSVTVGLGMTLLVLMTGGVEVPRPLSEWYAANSVSQAHGRNIVNVILVDFRALDTLGEITVLATAAVGVYSLLKLRSTRSTGEGS
jgi:multicomponent Na+:H+ antiporter subunit A